MHLKWNATWMHWYTNPRGEGEGVTLRDEEVAGVGVEDDVVELEVLLGAEVVEAACPDEVVGGGGVLVEEGEVLGVEEGARR